MTTDELVELARVAAQSGGLYASHLRDEGTELNKAVQEAIIIGDRGGLPVEIFHFKAFGQRPGKVIEAVQIIERARARGIDIAANQYPYVAASTVLSETVPAWAQDGGRLKMVERLKDPNNRERLRVEMKSEPPAYYGIGPENIRIASVHSERNRKYQGRSVTEIAKEQGVSPEDAIMDLLAEEDGDVRAIYFAMHEEDVKAVMQLPWISIGSDGRSLRPDGVLGKDRPHPRYYGTFPRVLGKYVREDKVLRLEDAVRKMTSLPAARLRLPDRGVLKIGMVADVVVFDADRVADRATFDNPHQYPEGIDIVIVNGQVVIDEGRHTGATPGRVLRGPGYRGPKRSAL
jgi:dihydroorotase/N-acyl-D-amino-acid deacylase